MANEWFRKASWSEADQADFYARLKRSRSAGRKAQYLRIQAYHLEETGAPELIVSALTHLERMISEFPEASELACAYTQKASCLRALGQTDKAVACYRRALDTERKNPSRRTRARLEFGRLVCESKLVELYDEALAVLDELRPAGLLFPVDVYEYFGIRALVVAHRGDVPKARQFAEKALEAAAESESGFRYHPTLGLVRDKQTPFFNSVKAIAESWLFP